MSRFIPNALAALALAPFASAQMPYRHFTEAVDQRTSRTQPIVAYTLRVNPEDLSSYSVEMRIRNASDTLRLAMAAHPEYDDRYRRYVEEFTVETNGIITPFVHEDSAVWRAIIRGGQAVVRYRIKLPAPQESPRAAWKPYLSATGGLVGGPHSFMYVVGAVLAPSHVSLDLPQGWQVATGLGQTASPNTWYAPTVDALMDSPMFVGRFHSWGFAIDGVPHRVVFWAAPNAASFDTMAFVGGVQRIAQQAINTFGRAPYRDFTFIMQDNAYGGLEHRNSVTLGVSSAALATNATSSLAELAHEYTHTWNLMRIRPEEYSDVTWKTQAPVAGLWFSEGLTMHFADVFSRRAALPGSDSTRKVHLETLASRYLSNPGYSRFSAERISQVAYNAQPGALGDYSPSVHLAGEVIGNVLDIVIRDATDNRKSMEDVMQVMLDRFSGARGFNGRDVEKAVTDVCGCNVHSIFEDHVRGAKAIDLERYLRLAGLQLTTRRTPVLNRDGTPALDLRFRAYLPDGGGPLRAIVTDPASAWGRAGLHSNDEIVSINGKALTDWSDVRPLVVGAKAGDMLHFEVRRKGVVSHHAVVMSGYDRVAPTITDMATVSEKQRRIRNAILIQ